ncbi:hypothetical protein [Bifidobacterium olomucense]|uniref:Uncharacterized protein n=1 Tax=Bifidobacterium olomucense TaxID=2675324 RepID=A0A7Y0HWF4_9BIFI|nr:hypothetical protein [Bifidobacterium sp. DSM 109959]NMM97593.1 hypothetical protein [Bifidobacterium sp. DSM 109959]
MSGMGCLEPVDAVSIGRTGGADGGMCLFAEGSEPPRGGLKVRFRSRVNLAMYMELVGLDAVRFLPGDLARGIIDSPTSIDAAKHWYELGDAIGVGAAVSGGYVDMFVEGARRDPDLIPAALTGIADSDRGMRVRAAARAFHLDTDVPVELIEEDLRDALHMTGERMGEWTLWSLIVGDPNDDDPRMLIGARPMLIAEPSVTREAGEALVAALRGGEDSWATTPSDDDVAAFNRRVQAEAVERLHGLRDTYPTTWPEPYLAATDPDRQDEADEAMPAGLDGQTANAIRDWRAAMGRDDWNGVIDAHERFKYHRHGSLPSSIVNDTYHARWGAEAAVTTPTLLPARRVNIISGTTPMAPGLADYRAYGISAITTGGATVTGREAALRYAANILRDPTNLRYASPEYTNAAFNTDANALIQEATGDADDPKWQALAAILAAILRRTEGRRSQGYDPNPYTREPQPRTSLTQQA